MKRTIRHQVLIWAFVVMVFMNIGMLATILYHHFTSNQLLTDQTENKQNLEFKGKAFNGRFVREELGLNQEQMEAFRAFNPEFRNKTNMIAQNLSDYRRQMFEEMNHEIPDQEVLNAMSDSIGNLHAQLKKITIQYYLNLKNICSADQQLKLNELFRQVFASDYPAFTTNGNQHGKNNRKRPYN